ncbi:HAMP domain-containing sensor histidine kinase [Pontibacter sp. JAM-7]|uniref:HAMP domain-containing sensor histidine kinase n=1 Tax=Pontibacter sp. JAM-7 TaxID=3366581 RepID=UPI003AF57F37
MKHRLLWKFLGINVAVISTLMIVVWCAIDYLAADYFMVLMNQYHIEPGDAHNLFLNTVHRYLIWGSALGLFLSLVLSFLLTRRLLRPLSRMADATRSLAAGDYQVKVPVEGNDETAQLAESFNQMACALARIEYLREQMVADAAHELRTPLSNIQGYLEAMRDGVIEPSADTLNMLHGEVLRLAKLAESLLNLARADAACADLNVQTVSISQMIAEAIDLGRPQLELRQLKPELQLAKECDLISVDPDKLRQVLRNLVENAGHYATEGGRLKVKLSQSRQGLKLCFSNDGQTFSNEDASYIFERFYRADRSRGRGYGVAGLGLAIVKELVEAHGGEVGAKADATGMTHIWLWLPGELLVSTKTSPLAPGISLPQSVIAATE